MAENDIIGSDSTNTTEIAIIEEQVEVQPMKEEITAKSKWDKIALIKQIVKIIESDQISVEQKTKRIDKIIEEKFQNLSEEEIRITL